MFTAQTLVALIVVAAAAFAAAWLMRGPAGASAAAEAFKDGDTASDEKTGKKTDAYVAVFNALKKAGHKKPTPSLVDAYVQDMAAKKVSIRNVDNFVRSKGGRDPTQTQAPRRPGGKEPFEDADALDAAAPDADALDAGAGAQADARGAHGGREQRVDGRAEAAREPEGRSAAVGGAPAGDAQAGGEGKCAVSPAKLIAALTTVADTIEQLIDELECSRAEPGPAEVEAFTDFSLYA